MANPILYDFLPEVVFWDLGPDYVLSAWKSIADRQGTITRLDLRALTWWDRSAWRVG